MLARDPPSPFNAQVLHWKEEKEEQLKFVVGQRALFKFDENKQDTPCEFAMATRSSKNGEEELVEGVKFDNGDFSRIEPEKSRINHVRYASLFAREFSDEVAQEHVEYVLTAYAAMARRLCSNINAVAEMKKADQPTTWVRTFKGLLKLGPEAARGRWPQLLSGVMRVCGALASDLAEFRDVELVDVALEELAKLYLDAEEAEKKAESLIFYLAVVAKRGEVELLDKIRSKLFGPGREIFKVWPLCKLSRGNTGMLIGRLVAKGKGEEVETALVEKFGEGLGAEVLTFASLGAAEGLPKQATEDWLMVLRKCVRKLDAVKAKASMEAVLGSMETVKMEGEKAGDNFDLWLDFWLDVLDWGVSGNFDEEVMVEGEKVKEGGEGAFFFLFGGFEGFLMRFVEYLFDLSEDHAVLERNFTRKKVLKLLVGVACCKDSCRDKHNVTWAKGKAYLIKIITERTRDKGKDWELLLRGLRKAGERPMSLRLCEQLVMNPNRNHQVREPLDDAWSNLN